MARELMLLRHGKSDWSEQLDDFDRPLKERGKRGAQRIGVWLLQQELLPDLVISSPAERAIATARQTVNAMARDAGGIVQDRRVYAARVEDLLQVLADAPADARRVMMVGHNPGLEELTEYLEGRHIPLPSDGKLLPTATLAIIELPDDWQSLKAGDGQLTGITRASSLPRKFPYPDHKGKDLRDRPAYFYRQSSVIPYRMRDGRLEILAVMSNKRKHWVLPKGISEPGFSLQASAAKEAFEEAGIEGEVGEQSLGRYVYKKWGAECTVEVFPMEVTHMVDEATWEESHRGREWMTPKQAVKRVRQPALKPMILELAKQLEAVAETKA